MHAIKKPMNLDCARPFANTSGFKTLSPKISMSVAAKRQDKETGDRLKKSLSESGVQENPELRMEVDELNRIIEQQSQKSGNQSHSEVKEGEAG
jgi:hypothetical protein